VLAEYRVSRLYGHSSASGANRESDVDPIEIFEKKLIDSKFLTSDSCQAVWKKYDEESRRAAETVRQEPVPTSESVWDHTYANNENADWRKF
ncbi:MAG: thiamine pyrophosphate-dependent dehydrogenase E1 component subunit alpha, partial [Bdellovibrionaceae bacterium]|nr:thiamine pyrophosphate-dependent dehydrogenase E1 component subunit alpha [Pseudobdellovibrionaceae bacterium]